MRKIVEVEDKGGFEELIGDRITVFCCRYIYQGVLVEDGNDYLKLKDAGIIYETGPFDKKEIEDYQSLCVKEYFILKGSIESYGVLNKKP